MESSALTAVLLPLALGIIMLGLGLSLTVADFTRVIAFPRAAAVAAANLKSLVDPAKDEKTVG